jgi:hypothetical protein
VTVHVHIERLVVDGDLLGTGSGRSVGAALEEELAHLLSRDPATSRISARGSRPQIDAGQVGVAGSDAGALGRRVAGAVHRGLRR